MPLCPFHYVLVLVMELSDASQQTLKIGGGYMTLKEHYHSDIKGTLAWMAPEYICGEPFSKRSDVWR